MKENIKKKSYTSPRIEATSFLTEQGYATSGSGAKIGMGKGGIA